MAGKLTRRLGVIGTGRMGAALVRGLITGGAIAPDKVIANDPDRAALDALARETGIRTAPDNAALAAAADIILIALKPEIVRPVLERLRAGLGPGHLLVSIAAGIPIRAIEEAAGGERRIVRVMPNACCLIGVGASAYAVSHRTTPEDAGDVRTILESVGLAVEVNEAQLDAVTGLSGSGPAYVAIVIEALADGGVRMGLARADALRLAIQTVAGAAQLLLATGQHPAELKDAVTSPGGTTAAGLAALERAGVRAAFIDAVEAATRRATELGQAKK